MRIQEMRSGRAYLRRRVEERPETDKAARWESDVLEEVFREVFPESEFDLEFTDGVEASGGSSDLDEPRWSLDSFDGIEAGGLTYDQAARLLDILGENGINGLAIITDNAASRLAH
jgi:hypothetical protein